MKCPDCGGELVPVSEESWFFQICSNCGNGYNVNYDPPQVYFVNKKKEKTI